jgi:hypothetical protein
MVRISAVLKLLFLSLALVTGSCSAQQAPPTNSPAIVAFDLYMTCIRGEFTSGIPVVDNMKELSEFVKYLDDKCLTWTVVWFTPFTGYTIDKMSPERQGTFLTLRQNVLDAVIKELQGTMPRK